MTTLIKNEVQQIRWSDEYWQYRVAANITEYQSNLQKFMEKKQLELSYQFQTFMSIPWLAYMHKYK